LRPGLCQRAGNATGDAGSATSNEGNFSSENFVGKDVHSQ
jgi:hypothetical protein